MRTGTELLNKPIVSAESGEKMGRVEDLLLDERQNQVVAVIIQKVGWRKKPEMMPFSRIKAVGPDALIAGSIEDVTEEETAAMNRASVAHAVKDKRMVTTSGRDLGSVTDFYVDERTGAIEAYEISRGSLADIFTSRLAVPALDAVTVGPDVVLVSPQSASQMRRREEVRRQRQREQSAEL